MGNRSIVEKIEVKTKGEKKKDKDDDNDKKEKNKKQEIDIENYFTNNLNQYTSVKTEEKHDKEDNINFIYDNNGNLKQDEEYRYFYDYKNRLVKVEKVEKVDKKDKHKEKKDKKEKDEKKHEKESKIVSEYTYDILGRRIEKKTKEELIKYYYAGNNAILEEIYEIDDEELKLKETRENIYSNQLDDILAIVVTESEDEQEDEKEKKEKKKHKEDDDEKESKTYYYSKNHLGSIVAITDKKAKVIEKYTYDVFGKAYISHGKKREYKEFKKSKVGNTRLYTGREYDREIGLYYLRARYYNAEIGRFISRDPIDIRDDVNLYGYVGNGVVMYVDLSGKAKKFVAAYDEYIEAKNKWKIWKNILDGRGRYLNADGSVNMDYVITKKIQNNLYENYVQKENLARNLHYSRQNFNINLPNSIFDAEEKGWEQPTFAGSTYLGAYFHQDPNISGIEVKYISSDGYREIIFSATGIEILKDEYVGTYNFYSPTINPGLHEEYDVNPYYLWGNTINDKTTINERKIY